jgi:hypothetical protein
MSALSQFRTLFLVAALIVSGVSASIAASAPIQDDGAFFSESAKSEADRSITELEKATKKELVIRTFKELPADVKQGVNLEDKPAVKRVVSDWALKQARESRVNGVFILLVKSPGNLQIEVGMDTQKRAFTLRDRDTLESLMLAKLRAKQNDGALLDGVNFVSSTMRGNLPAGSHAVSTRPLESSRPRQTSSSGWLVPLIIGVVVIWAVMAIFRAIFRGGGGVGSGMGGMSPMGGGMGGGGGGFFSSLLGGVFGAAAGNWLYDQFSGNRGGSSLGADRGDQANVDQGNVDQGYSGKDTDYSGSGDSFGDNAGGGDSGSGDSGGGGDFGGGGDSGGSGDSGGGGDF